LKQSNTRTTTKINKKVSKKKSIEKQISGYKRGDTIQARRTTDLLRTTKMGRLELLCSVLLTGSIQAYVNMNDQSPIIQPALMSASSVSAACTFNGCPKTCHDVGTCPMGTGLVKDHCDCCYVCARQLNEYCDAYHPCDSMKGLHCVDNMCEAKEGRKCYVDRHVYKSGQSFNVSCTMTCTCIDGHLGCNPRCRSEPPPSINSCQEARLIRKRGQCCREWVCLDEFKTTNDRKYNRLKALADRDPSSQYWSVGGRVDAAYQIPISRKLRTSDNCLLQTSDWTECSRICGWGLSERVSNDNDRCRFNREVRLCQQRPCTDRNLLDANEGSISLPDTGGDEARFSRKAGFTEYDRKNELNTALKIKKRPKRCIRVRKSTKRVRFQFDGCMSTKLYRPRYCGACKDSRCCRPSKEKTITVNFKCDGTESFKYKMAMIRSCRCERDCSTVASVFANTGLFMGSDIAFQSSQYTNIDGTQGQTSEEN